MSIGTPPQLVRLLPSTSANAIWPIHPQGCTKDDPSDCQENRGSFFTSDNSSSWKAIGLYQLGLQNEASLGYSGNASLGYDSVRFGIADASSTVIPNQVIEAIATKDFYNGFIGLNGNAVNISSTLNSSTSLLTSLSDLDIIPSRSWAYTAGASWADPPVYGSLTLGGYDASRFKSTGAYLELDNPSVFPFGQDENRELMPYIQGISGHPKLESSSNTGFTVVLNTAVPDIWLPEATCDAFEAAFNLQYNLTTDRYSLNQTAYAAIGVSNPSVTFLLSTGPTAKAVNITMSWRSFDLVDKSIDTTPDGSRYFAIRRGQNTTQYTLGRAFFQDAYVIADWERSKFQVHQAIYPDLNTQSALQLIPPANTTTAQKESSGTSSKVIIGGAAGGAAFLLLIISLLAIFYIRRRRQRDLKKRLPVSSDTSSILKALEEDGFRKAELDAGGTSKAELCGSNVGSIYKPDDKADSTTELATPVGTWRSELPGSRGREKAELLGSPGAHESDAGFAGHESDAGFRGHEADAGLVGYEADAGPACAELEGDIPTPRNKNDMIGQAI